MTRALPSILFLGKQDNPQCLRAANFITEAVTDCRIELSERHTPLPKDLEDWQGDYIISYLCPHIIPGRVLAKATKAAINFHPGPPEYPGIGCTNQAIYNGETTFGITCHHMVEKVDSGNLIAVRRFTVSGNDSVFDLTERCYQEIEQLYYEIAECIIRGIELPKIPDRHWTQKPFTRKQLNELCKIDMTMTRREVERRIRAVTFPDQPGAYIRFHGYTFSFSPERTGSND